MGMQSGVCFWFVLGDLFSPTYATAQKAVDHAQTGYSQKL